MSSLAAAAAALALVPGACAGAAQPYSPGVNCRVIAVDGHPRQFLVYVPRRRPAGRAPVVLMYHGSSGSGARFLRISGWREQADAAGFVAVFPTGLRYRVLESGRRSTKWNGYGLAADIDLNEKPRGYPADAPWPADDVGFTDAILADLRGQLPIDERRIYASGFSNGAEFAARLAVERSTVIAAAGLAAGALYAPQAQERPVPTYLTVGSIDDRVLGNTELTELPLDPGQLLAVPPIAHIVGAHLTTAGLAPRPFTALVRRRSTSLLWPEIGDPVFRFSVLAGLGHHYPNGNALSAGFRAAPEFWRFFRAHPLPVTAREALSVG